jgi:LPXTG-motif cell wall-anchored protein
VFEPIPPRRELEFSPVPRLASFIAALVLALPGTAFAQGAGDDQYQDPFGDQQEQQDGSGSGSQDGGLSEEPPVTGGGSGSGSSGSGSSGSGSSGSGAAPSTGTQAAPQPVDQLPNTGSDPRMLMLAGLAFVLMGAGLRLRTIDPDAF